MAPTPNLVEYKRVPHRTSAQPFTLTLRSADQHSMDSEREQTTAMGGSYVVLLRVIGCLARKSQVEHR